MPKRAPTPATHVAFVDARRLALGSVNDVQSALRRHEAKGTVGLVLVFELATGKQIELEPAANSTSTDQQLTPVKGPGRPKLGVLSREITLLPRHWEWLEAQELGISATLRRLVEDAMRHPSAADLQRAAQSAVSRFLFTMAGNRPNYEEACRALFASDAQRFAQLIQAWPKGIQEVIWLMAEAAFAET